MSFVILIKKQKHGLFQTRYTPRVYFFLKQAVLYVAWITQITLGHSMYAKEKTVPMYWLVKCKSIMLIQILVVVKNVR